MVGLTCGSLRDMVPVFSGKVLWGMTVLAFPLAPVADNSVQYLTRHNQFTVGLLLVLARWVGAGDVCACELVCWMAWTRRHTRNMHVSIWAIPHIVWDRKEQQQLHSTKLSLLAQLTKIVFVCSTCIL